MGSGWLVGGVSEKWVAGWCFWVEWWWGVEGGSGGVVSSFSGWWDGVAWVWLAGWGSVGGRERDALAGGTRKR